MVAFVAGKPLTTDTPVVVVDAGLPVGRHRFQLVVVNAAGTASKPSEIVVQVQRFVPPPVVGPIVTGPITGPLTGPITAPTTGPIVGPPVVDPIRPPGPLQPVFPNPPTVLAPNRGPTARRGRRNP